MYVTHNFQEFQGLCTLFKDSYIDYTFKDGSKYLIKYSVFHLSYSKHSIECLKYYVYKGNYN